MGAVALVLVIVLMSFATSSTASLKTFVIGLLMGLAVPAFVVWLLQTKRQDPGGCLPLFISGACVILSGVVAVV